MFIARDAPPPPQTPQERQINRCTAERPFASDDLCCSRGVWREHSDGLCYALNMALLTELASRLDKMTGPSQKLIVKRARA